MKSAFSGLCAMCLDLHSSAAVCNGNVWSLL